MPDWKNEVRTRLTGLNIPPTREASIVEELSQHLEDRYNELLASGLPVDAAYHITLTEHADYQSLVNQLQRMERPNWADHPTSDSRRNDMFGNLIQDLRYSFRVLIKSPGFALVSIISLALGIGANTAIFSLINATLIRQLPVVQPERLVYVYNGQIGSVFSYPAYVDLRDQNKVFDGFVAWGGITASLNADQQTDVVVGAIVTGNFFQVLGVKPGLGRLISVEDDKVPGGHPVAVISSGLWQRRFGGDQNIIGRQITLNGQGFTVIGVTPSEFTGAQLGVNRDLFVPMMMQPLMRPPRAGYSGEMNPDLLKIRYNQWLSGLGRLKPGVTVEQAQAALNINAVEIGKLNNSPIQNPIFAISPVNIGDPGQRDQMVSVARLLMLVVGAVLLIACGNVANLLLVRATARQKEIAIRMAIGAQRSRLIKQFLTESVVLSVIGGAAGLFLGWIAVGALKASPPPAGALPINPNFQLDVPVLAFTLGLSLVTGIVFGLLPAIRASRPDLIPALKDETFVPPDGARRFTLRNILVIAQVALSLVLLISAGLFLRSLREANAINPGFDANKLVIAPLNINLLRYTSTRSKDFFRQVTDRVQTIPGVESASLARIVQLGINGGSVRSLLIEGRAGEDAQLRSEGGGVRANGQDTVNSNVVTEKYFQTMGIAVLQGRDFGPQDTESSPKVIVVNEAFVNRHFPGEQAMGKRISFRGVQGPWNEIVGIVRNSKYLTIGETATPIAYLPLSQNNENGMTLHVRTSVDPSTLVAAIRLEIQSLDKNLPVNNVSTMTDSIGNSLYAARMGAILLGGFSVLAVVLAAVGLYGVMSFSVSRRTREIGIRMALGGDATSVLRMIMKDGMLMVVIGIVIGLGAAKMFTRLLGSFLYNISTTDVITFVSIPILLLVMALLACFLPARRATKIDPMEALRSQ